MTSAISPNVPNPLHATTAPIAAPGTTSPSAGAVPAQPPVRSYATATKTASPAPPAQAGASAQNAQSTDTSVNGANNMAAQGGSQPNGTSSHSDHSRKASVVINASGATGQIPNGGPVGQNGRPPISFGSMGASGSPLPQPSVPHQSQASSLPAPSGNPRVISPAHSPSPIPQPPASGGRPPSGLQGQSNGVTFGQLGGDNDAMRQTQMPLGPGMPSMHERRQSSQSMHSDMSNSGMQNMNRNFVPPGGRGRGFQPQPYGQQMPSPAPNFRSVPNQQGPRPNMGPQFPQPPNSPYGRGRGSPAIQHAQPHMPHGQMGYGYPPEMAQHMYGQQQFNPYGGYYPPYQYGYPQNQPPQSPRPPYPTPYGAPQGPMQPPFQPPDMSRSASQSSQRPPSSLGHSQTPSLSQPAPSSGTPAPQPSQTPSNFIRPKKTSAIKITDAQGNEVNFNKAAPSPSTQAHPQTPVIVSTPNAPTPPPRTPSSQHNRADSKPSTKSAEETKNAFQEQVKRQMEEAKRKAQEQDQETASAKADKEEKDVQATKERDAQAAKEREAQATKERDAQATKEREEAEQAAKDQIKEATAAAEKAAAADAKDKEAKEAAEAAEKAATKAEGEKTEKEETEDERLEREIAEMEAREKEEEERERAFQEKRQREKAEQAKRQAEKDANADEELKRQEREAEAREEARERERTGEKEAEDTPVADEESKSMFASLKKPALGPGATSEPEEPAEAPTSEKASADSASMPPPSSTQPRSLGAGAAKPKPAHLKLETSKRVEPAEPTPGMQSLKSARFLSISEEANYPDGFKSPNPALNVGAPRKARAYDKDFLLQFQPVFKEKPSVDWDKKVKETLGPSDDASRSATGARTPSGMSRQPSGRPGVPGPAFSMGQMGQFSGGAARPVGRGTTSEERFAAAQQGVRPAGGMPGQMGGRMPSNLGMGAPGMGMSRTNSLQTMGGMGAPGSPRQQSSRGGRGGGSRRGDRTMSRKEEADLASKMPLTAHLEISPLVKSGSGWKPTSLSGSAAAAGPDPTGLMAPDVVQRKVKAALNKMTPEKFDKISDQILEIAGQSKHETDGRTLRQVIQLTFEKACDEAHWAGMYAKFCHRMLTSMSSEIKDEDIKDKNGSPVVGGALFRKYLLNRCQEEFERGWQVNLPEAPEGDSKEAALLSDEYYIAAAAKRRGLGLIQFIGQLYKLRMLTLRIMHECVMKLLNFEGDPDEAAVENLTTLLKTVGATMNEDEQGRQMIGVYFDRINEVLLKSEALGSRPRFMILDLVDLRKAGWKGKDDAKGPKTIEQIHQEADEARAKADAERMRQNQRGGSGRPPAGRGDARNFSAPPVDYSSGQVRMDDLRRLQQRGASNRATGGGLGPGGNLGPGGGLGARANSRRGLGPPSSGNTTRTNTPPVDKEKKDEPSTAQNAFSALASLDQSGDTADDTASQSEAASPPTARTAEKTAEAS